MAVVKEPKSFIEDLVGYPSILLLGQDYLRIDGGEDLFLASLLNKFLDNLNETRHEIGYDLLFESKIKNEPADSFAWMYKLSKRLTPPNGFEKVSRIPWSSVYTSAIDTILIDAFQNEWRDTQPVYNKNHLTSNPRNRFELNINYLFGCINQVDEESRIPFSLLKKTTRENQANAWLQKIPELLTTRGKLCIEGYNPNRDWLSIKVLFSVIESLEDEQVYFFSFKENYKKNQFINALIREKKIIPIEASLTSYLHQCLGEEDVDISEIENDSLYGKWINIRGKRSRVPKELKSRLIKSAVILDDTLTLPKKIKSKEDRYLEFKRFLSKGSSQPYWSGFGNDFAFTRSFVINISKQVKHQFEANSQIDEPIINYGQSSSGKTIGLGNIGHYIASELKLPVLFIPRNYRSPNEIDLDIFCEWAEEKGARFTIIIWDGMVESENYYKLLKRLNARGRKIIVIGSCYKKNTPISKQNYKKNNYIEAEIELDSKEQERLEEYLAKNLPNNDYLKDLLKRSGERNFLAILYRFLPQTKMNIQEGLTAEINKFSEYIINNATNKTNYKPETRLGELLNEAGLVEDVDLEKEIEVDNERLDIREQFIQYIMIPGQFGLDVPFELLLRCLGAEVLNSTLFEELRKTDIVSWSEDKIGNIFIGPRTAIEGVIIARTLGSRKAKLEVIKNLISHIRIDQNRVNTNGRRDPKEVNFAVELLQKIGPNSDSEFKNEDLLEVANVLENLRLRKHAYHPRLVLQEASYLREIAKDERLNSSDLLNKSEELLHDEIEKFESESFSKIKTYFQVELASTLGTRVYNLLKSSGKQNKEEILKYYNMAKREVLSSKEDNPENYPALDVLLWTTRDLIQSNILSDEELVQIQADLFHLVDFVEQEGIGDNYREKFEGRKLEIGETLDDKEISKSAFKQLEEQNSASGYYIKSRYKLGKGSDINMSDIPNKTQLKEFEEAYKYLEKNYEKISSDGRAVYFMFRLWWLIKAKKPFFYREKLRIPFNESDWIDCLKFTNHLMGLDSLYETPTILYQGALSLFHLGHYKKALDTFKTISAKSDYSTVYGSRRIKKYHLASNEDGSLKIFSGEAAFDIQRSDKQRKGYVFINEIQDRIPFMLYDFKMREVAKGKRFNKLAIAFNFRGPLAIPSNFLNE